MGEQGGGEDGDDENAEKETSPSGFSSVALAGPGE